MGFRLSSFLGGAAEQAVKTIESREKDARDTGLLAGKSLYAQYAAITKENAEVSAEIKANLEVLKTHFPNMDERTATEMANRKSVMSAVTSRIKDGSLDPSLVDINMLRTFVKNNAPEVAVGKIDQTAEISTMVKGLMTKKETDAALSEKKPKGMMEQYYEGFANRGFNEYAASVGVSPEQIRSVKRLSDRPMDESITFDMSKLRPAEKYDALKDRAQVALVNATKSGDAAAIAKATEGLSAFTAVTASQQSEVVRAAETRAKLDRVASEGGAAAVEAKAQIKVLDKLKQDSNVATAIPRVKGDDDAKPFSFTTLKSAVSTSIAVRMSNEFGQDLKDNVAWVSDTSDNTLNARFIGNDPGLRKQFNEITRSTVEHVLGGLNPNDQNVKMIRQVFNPPAPQAAAEGTTQATPPKTPATPPETPATPPETPATAPAVVTPPAEKKQSGFVQGLKDFVSPASKSSGLGSRPAGPMLVQKSEESQVIASGIPYEPTKYMYKFPADGTVQRKPK